MLNRIVIAPTGIVILCLLVTACGTSTGVVFDPDKTHHGDGEFVSVKQGSFLDHYRMRQREPEPSPRDLQDAFSPLRALGFASCHVYPPGIGPGPYRP